MAYDLETGAVKLDITSWKQKGVNLAESIEKEIKPLATSKLVVTLPSILAMTQTQYDDLMKVSGMPNMFHSQDRMYITKYNIMEVRVKDRTRATFDEMVNMNRKELKQWEKSVEGERDDDEL